MSKVAVVTGANRGLGKETARALAKKDIHVIVTSRDSSKGESVLSEFKKEGLSVEFFELDVSKPESISSLAKFIEQKHGHLDILVNNAGIFLDRGHGDSADPSALRTPIEIVRTTFETNVLGPFQLCQALIPLMRKNRYGRIVNVSSGMGQLTDMKGGFPAYRISKTALNAVTRIFADEIRAAGILVNSVCPGWVKTDMGGPSATRTLDQGIDSIVWLATLPNDGPTGGFFRDREPIDW